MGRFKVDGLDARAGGEAAEAGEFAFAEDIRGGAGQGSHTKQHRLQRCCILWTLEDRS